MRLRVPFKNLAGPVPAVRLSTGGTALLVVDCHRFTTSRDSGYGRLAGERGIARELDEYYEQLVQVLPNLRRLVGGCRERAVPVVFTRLVRSAGDAGLAVQAAATGFWSDLASPEADFMPDLYPRAGEPVVNKTTMSAFAATNIQATLGGLNIRHLLIAGVLANGAVDLSARAAADIGYNVVVVSDACAAETWTLHAVVMTTLAGGLIRVRTVEAALEMLDGTRS
jgi:nicotinamidase-related amidase